MCIIKTKALAGSAGRREGAGPEVCAVKAALKKSFLLFALLSVLVLLAACAEREPEETEKPKEKGEIAIDADWYREEFLAREEQEGYVPLDSKYGYDLPEITGFTEGFEDYLGQSVTLSAPYEGVMRDFLEDGEGGVFVFRTVRTTTESGLEVNRNDGIVYYNAEGIPSRICADPDCEVGKPCTHGMDIAGSYVQYWRGNLYFIGYRQEPWGEDDNPAPGQGLPVRSYVMRCDVKTGEFRKVIEFFDRTCYMFVIRDGVLFLVSGEDPEVSGASGTKYLSSVDLATGDACRICVGKRDVYGICEGRLVLQSPEIGRGWNAAEFRVQLMDPEEGTFETIATYTAPYCGAAGKYALYLGRWETGLGYDLYRRDPNADNPEVMGRNVVKFRARGDICVWLTADGELWRSPVNVYSPRKLAKGVADFRIQEDGRIVYFARSGLKKVKTRDFGIETLGNGSLWVTSGFFQKEKVWEASGSTCWLGVCAVGESTAFVTAMYYEILYPDTTYQYRETRIIKQDLNGESPQILYRRLYSMSDEEYRAHQTTVNETYLERENAWKIGPYFRYYPVKPEKYK